jgi:hypothetical protein
MNEANKYNITVFFLDANKHRVTYHKIHSVKKFVQFAQTKQVAFLKVYNRYTNTFLGNICLDENLSKQDRFKTNIFNY